MDKVEKEKRQLTLKEKWDSERDDPLFLIDGETGKQYWAMPDGRKIEVKPGDPAYNDWHDK